MLLLHKYSPVYIDDLLHSNQIVEILQHFMDIKYFNLLLIGGEDCGKSTIINTMIQECMYQNFITHNDIYRINNFQINTFIDYLNKMRTFCQCNVNANKPKFVILENLDTYNENNQQFIKSVIQDAKQNVHFIVTTSCINDIIEPIQSALFQINIPKFDKHKMFQHFKHISEMEKLNIDDESILQIMNMNDYSYTNTVSCLEKVKLHESFETSYISIESNFFKDYLLLCNQNDVAKAYKKLYRLYTHGFTISDIIDELYKYIKYINDEYQLISVLCEYINDVNNGCDDSFQLYFMTFDICSIVCDN